MNEIELTKEGLLEFFNRAYAGFAGEDGDYTDVLIDGTYDLEELANAIMSARLQERESIAQMIDSGDYEQHFYEETHRDAVENILGAIRARK